MKEKNADKNPWKSLGLFAVIVFDIVGYTLGGIGVGYGLEKLGLPSWGMAVTGALGFSLAMYQVYLISKKEMQ